LERKISVVGHMAKQMRYDTLCNMQIWCSSFKIQTRGLCFLV